MHWSAEYSHANRTWSGVGHCDMSWKATRKILSSQSFFFFFWRACFIVSRCLPLIFLQVKQNHHICQKFYVCFRLPFGLALKIIVVIKDCCSTKILLPVIFKIIHGRQVWLILAVFCLWTSCLIPVPEVHRLVCHCIVYREGWNHYWLGKLNVDLWSLTSFKCIRLLAIK